MERIIDKSLREKINAVGGLDLPDFSQPIGIWRINKLMRVSQGNQTRNIKLRVVFDLDNTSSFARLAYPAKIGPYLTQQDENLLLPFIGFIYGDRKDKSELINLAQQFPFAQLISNLNEEFWTSQENSNTENIKVFQANI